VREANHREHVSYVGKVRRSFRTSLRRKMVDTKELIVAEHDSRYRGVVHAEIETLAPPCEADK